MDHLIVNAVPTTLSAFEEQPCDPIYRASLQFLLCIVCAFWALAKMILLLKKIVSLFSTSVHI